MNKRDERGEERFGYFEVGQIRVVYIRSDFNNRALFYRSTSYIRTLFPASQEAPLSREQNPSLVRSDSAWLALHA